MVNHVHLKDKLITQTSSKLKTSVHYQCCKETGNTSHKLGENLPIIHHSVIYNGQKLSATLTSVNKWMDNQTMDNQTVPIQYDIT